MASRKPAPKTRSRKPAKPARPALPQLRMPHLDEQQLDLVGLGLVALAAGIFLPHLIQDDGRLLTRYIGLVKGSGAANTSEVFKAVDQSFHLIVLFATALIVHAAVK